MKKNFVLFLLFIICSCNSREPKEQSTNTPPIFPDYTSTVIPYNIAPLHFEIDGAFYISASFRSNGEILGESSGKRVITIPKKKWQHWLKTCKGGILEVEVSAWLESHPEGIRYKPFQVHVSSNPIDEWVAYRLIEPGYEYWSQMGIYQRNLTSFTENAIVTNDLNDQGCMNCHSFHNYSPKKMLFHARGKNGTTVLVKNNKPERLDFEKLKNDLKATYPMWHPSGDYIVFSSNQTHQSFYHWGKTPIEVYDIASDLFIYDLKNNKVLTDDRLVGADHFETFPAFSPDGSFLYYCVADKKNMPMENRELKYAICRVPFDQATGALGHPIDTLYNPLLKGGSASHPRLSPNGQFLLYTETACATFPIWHREADLKMIRLFDGQETNTKLLNSEEAESYHSWSSNGQWIVFSSRQLDGRYTRLFIAAVDSSGTFSKPFLLPQKDPRHNTTRLKSYNIPEFVNEEVKLNKKDIAALFD